MTNKQELTKEVKIKRELSKFRGLFKNVEIDKKLYDDLIQKAAFLSVSITELQDIINEKGYIEEYQHGQNQSGFKKSTEVDIYATFYKNYVSTMKLIIDLLPDEKEASKIKAGTNLVNFIAKGKPK